MDRNTSEVGHTSGNRKNIDLNPGDELSIRAGSKEFFVRSDNNNEVNIKAPNFKIDGQNYKDKNISL
jgi:hypothetical protein